MGFLLKGLYLQEGFSFYSWTVGNTAKTNSYARYYQGVPQTSDQSTYLRSNGYWSSGKERWLQGNITAGWDAEWGKHRLNASPSPRAGMRNGASTA